MQVGDIVVEKRMEAVGLPFHAQLSIITKIDPEQLKVMLKNIRTGGEYWLYIDTVEPI